MLLSPTLSGSDARHDVLEWILDDPNALDLGRSAISPRSAWVRLPFWPLLVIDVQLAHIHNIWLSGWAQNRTRTVQSVALYSPEQGISPGQLVRPVESEEELRRVGIPLAGIGHTEQTSPVEFQSTVYLIFERFAIDAISSSSSTCRIAGLDDEALDEAMEDYTVVVAFLLAIDRSTIIAPSIASCRKFRTVLGHSFPHSST